MNTNEYKIEWCLNWHEGVRGFPACYGVSFDQERELRKLHDVTGDVLYCLNLHHMAGLGWRLNFGIDYIPNHQRLTKWHENVADCWLEMLTLGVSETTMEIIERDISGSDIYSDRAPRMLEYFRELCSAQAKSPDVPEV